MQLAGATLTVPGAYDLIGRVVADAASLKQMRRQSSGSASSAGAPIRRSATRVAAAIDAALASLRFIALADGTRGG